jgi:hypothetical protein
MITGIFLVINQSCMKLLLLYSYMIVINYILVYRYDKEGIVGCVLADHAGLCLGGKSSKIQLKEM